jgi:hypothetical protein
LPFFVALRRAAVFFLFKSNDKIPTARPLAKPKGNKALEAVVVALVVPLMLHQDELANRVCEIQI